MNGFEVKLFLAELFEKVHINNFLLNRMSRIYSNNHVRVINYHHSPKEDQEQFVKQIQWFKKYYSILSLTDLEKFISGELLLKNKPGLVITFDDGFLDNYNVAHQILKKDEIPAIYMVSYGLIGVKKDKDNSYIDLQQLKNMINDGATIGCHTYSHHRMNISDSDELLHHEIIESKKKLEIDLDCPIEVFCWCGGEERTYTKRASDLIRSSGYSYGFMTNSFPVLPGVDRFQLDRSNIETSWPISLVKFQLSGIIDWKLQKKRQRVHLLTK